MKKLVLALLAAGVSLAAVTPAVASQGCGRGGHRDFRGFCRPNFRRGPVLIAPGLIIGNFYPGRGYWDGRGYYQHRFRDHDGWRYR